jgi:hypothetical protein
MKELIVFISGLIAGSAGVLLWASGLASWPPEKRRKSARHSREGSWLR